MKQRLNKSSTKLKVFNEEVEIKHKTLTSRK